MSSPRQTRASKSTPQSSRHSLLSRHGNKITARKSEKLTSGEHIPGPLKEINDDGSVLWNDDTEAILFRNVCRLKPVGPMKHWKMLLIRERLSNALDHPVSSEAIWAHLANFYDLNALEELEIVEKNEVNEPFSLPRAFHGLKSLREVRDGQSGKDGRFRKTSTSTFGKGDSDIDDDNGGPSTPSSFSKKSVPSSPKAEDEFTFPNSPDVGTSESTPSIRKPSMNSKPSSSSSSAKRGKISEGGKRRRTSSESLTKGEPRKSKGTPSVKKSLNSSSIS